jgi:hypothetical protein
MNWLWINIKKGAWKVVLTAVIIATVILFLYGLIRPEKDYSSFLRKTSTNIKTAIKENEIRATLEQDKIGTIKKIYDQKLKETKRIADRDERLKALIRLQEELEF